MTTTLLASATGRLTVRGLSRNEQATASISAVSASHASGRSSAWGASRRSAQNPAGILASSAATLYAARSVLVEPESAEGSSHLIKGSTEELISPLIRRSSKVLVSDSSKERSSREDTFERFHSTDEARDEPCASSSQETDESNKRLWKAEKTTRRGALATCFALATIIHHGPGLHQFKKHARNPRDLITLSTSPSAAEVSAKDWADYGDLVTVSTGSPDYSGAGEVRGLPTWMRGNYQLCMGDGFHVQIPTDWQLQESEGLLYGTVLRYEDKADPSTNVIVIKSPTSQSRTEALGDPEEWIRNQAYLLTSSNEPIQFQSGDDGAAASMQFPSGRISIAKILDVDTSKSKQGLAYYTYEIVIKQGGGGADLHELLSAVVNDGNLYMCRVQTEVDSWQKSTQSVAQQIVDSFQITGFKIHV